MPGFALAAIRKSRSPVQHLKAGAMKRVVTGDERKAPLV